MMFKSLLLPALASVAYAESTVTSMFIYGADTQPLAASIVGNDQSATTYSINCTPGTDASDCGMGPGLTLIAGKDVTSWIFDDGPAFQYTAECSIKNSKAVCTESAGGSEANFPGISTTTTTVEYMPVTITAGSVTDSGDEATTTSSASSGATSSAAQASETPSASGSETDSASETASQTGEDASPTGAAARVGGGVRVMVAGVIVAVVGLVL